MLFRSYKIESRQLKLADIFHRGDDEPYVVHPHILAGRKLGTRPKAMPEIRFEQRTGSDLAGFDP